MYNHKIKLLGHVKDSIDVLNKFKYPSGSDNEAPKSRTFMVYLACNLRHAKWSSDDFTRSKHSIVYYFMSLIDV